MTNKGLLNFLAILHGGGKQVYLKPILPEPPTFLIEKDYPIKHVSKPKVPVDYEKISQIINDRRDAEIGFANLYSEKIEIEEFGQKLLRKIHSFERYKARVRKLYLTLKDSDGSVAVTSKMLQKDLYVAERTVDNEGFT